MSESNFDVTGFMQDLEKHLPKSFNNSPRRSLEKVYLSFPGNYGKYQIFPMLSSVTDRPYVYLSDTRQVKVQRRRKTESGEEQTYDAWLNILPASAYVMKDETGRVVSSLTREDENTLIQAQTLFDSVYDALGGNLKRDEQDKNKTIGLLRKKDYILFMGKVLNHWAHSQTNGAAGQKPTKQNYPALFVTTAKKLSDAINNDIADKTISYQGDQSWLGEVYNRDLTERGGYLIFSCVMGVSGSIGYTCTAKHETDKQAYLKNDVITAEEAELMGDPLERFLGAQASTEYPGRLFNRFVYQDIIAHLNEMLVKIRMSGAGDGMAAATTSAQAMGTFPQGQSNDPMVRTDNPYGRVVNPDAVMNGNNNPSQQPPAAHMDPIGMNPVGGQQQANPAPFTKPSFGEFGSGNSPFGG